jgi:predicted transcriptional regulator
MTAPIPSPERPSKRERTQLTIQASPDLLAKVRRLAEQRRQTVTAVVVEAIEAWIDGDQVLSAGEDDLRQRVEAIEARLAALEGEP